MDTMLEQACSLDEISGRAAAFISHRAAEAAQARGLFSLAISGGRTPRLLFNKLAAAPHVQEFPWRQTRLFFVDERMALPDDPFSNFGMAHRELISRVPLDPLQVFPMPVDKMPGEAGPAEYEARIRAIVPAGAGGLPSFDLLLLGLGPDGHTASLFPGHALLEENRRLIACVTEAVGTPPLPRMTFTFPLLNAARTALFLASMRGKERVIEAAIRADAEARAHYPAARVHPAETLAWFLDTSQPGEAIV